jgi:hypothetical protein
MKQNIVVINKQAVKEVLKEQKTKIITATAIVVAGVAGTALGIYLVQRANDPDAEGCERDDEGNCLIDLAEGLTELMQLEMAVEETPQA